MSCMITQLPPEQQEDEASTVRTSLKTVSKEAVNCEYVEKGLIGLHC